MFHSLLVKLKYFIVVFLIVTIRETIQSRKDDSPTYLAATVDFNLPLIGSFEKNLDNYLTLINVSASQNVDIMVFPETGLSGNVPAFTRNQVLTIATYVPDADENISPCSDSTGRYSSALKTLSCAAQDAHLYLTINLPEKLECNEETQKKMQDTRPCASDGYYIFNTNVVFDRQGTVVARYRKFNLFGEYTTNTTVTPEIIYFDTDFNVRFGTFICFDILFASPALDLSRDLHITDYVFSTRWFSELPSLTAVQIQQSWSFSQNSNFIASEVNQPSQGSTGSGIYDSVRNTDFLYLTGDAQTTLLISEVQKRTSTNSLDEIAPKSEVFSMMKFYHTGFDGLIKEIDPPVIDNAVYDKIKLVPYNLTNYVTQLIDTSQSNNVCLCNNGLCCQLNYGVRSLYEVKGLRAFSNIYQYRFITYNGPRSFSGVVVEQIQTCGIVACLDDTVDSCLKRFDHYHDIEWPFVFENITITGNFQKADEIQAFPNSLTAAMVPLPRDQWTYQRLDDNQVQFRLLEEQNQLLTFVIYARNYTEVDMY